MTTPADTLLATIWAEAGPTFTGTVVAGAYQYFAPESAWYVECTFVAGAGTCFPHGGTTATFSGFVMVHGYASGPGDWRAILTGARTPSVG